MDAMIPDGARRDGPGTPEPRPIRLLDEDEREPVRETRDPAALVLTCANCGATMDERKCKLICRCGYFASCSDYY
jgi:hypothetical protein